MSETAGTSVVTSTNSVRRRSRVKQPGTVSLPSGATVKLERKLCARCDGLVTFFGGQILSGAFAIRADCPKCGHENIFTFETA